MLFAVLALSGQTSQNFDPPSGLFFFITIQAFGPAHKIGRFIDTLDLSKRRVLRDYNLVINHKIQN